MQRASHAVALDGRVWVIDPVAAERTLERARELGDPAGVVQLLDRHGRDCRAVAEHLGVPRYEVPDRLPAGAAFEVLPLLRRRWWHEVALWYPEQWTLVCAEAVGTAQYKMNCCQPRHPGLGEPPQTEVLKGLVLICREYVF